MSGLCILLGALLLVAIGFWLETWWLLSAEREQRDAEWAVALEMAAEIGRMQKEAESMRAAVEHYERMTEYGTPATGEADSQADTRPSLAAVEYEDDGLSDHQRTALDNGSCLGEQ